MYDYVKEREVVFTEKGQRAFLEARDFVQETLEVAGAVRMQEIMRAFYLPSSWQQLACVDRLVELGELREIPQVDAPAQHRIFVRARHG